MKRIASSAVLTIAAILFCTAVREERASAAPQPPAAAARSPKFPVFDAMSFTRKPDLRRLGMERIYVTGNDFWSGRYPNYDLSKPNEAACRALARRVARVGQILVIDIEHWPVDVRKASKSEVAASLDKLAQIADWIHDERPEVKLGFYGILPIQDYWTPVQLLTARERPDSPWHRGNLPKFEAANQQWLEANRVVAEALAEKVDYVFPSLYTFYNDPHGWSKYAKATIEEARKFDKPVFPFLWMEFHDSSEELKGTLIPGDLWSLQLKSCRALADGVVIWGGWKRTWTPDAEWWQRTMDFMRRQQAVAR